MYNLGLKNKNSNGFNTIAFADVMTTEINGINIVTYNVSFNNPFESVYDVVELLNILEKSGITFMILCNGQELTKYNPEIAVGESNLFMNEETFIILSYLLKKYFEGIVAINEIAEIGGYVSGQIIYLIPCK